MKLTKKQIESKGFKVTFTNGTGAGGQARNRTYSVAVVQHLESGATNRCDETRNAGQNMNIAYNKIVKELEAEEKSQKSLSKNALRKKILEKGVIRTYDYKRNRVKNHITGSEADLKKTLDGDIEPIQE